MNVGLNNMSTHGHQPANHIKYVLYIKVNESVPQIIPTHTLNSLI